MFGTLPITNSLFGAFTFVLNITQLTLLVFLVKLTELNKCNTRFFERPCWSKLWIFSPPNQMNGQSQSSPCSNDVDVQLVFHRPTLVFAGRDVSEYGKLL